MPTRLDVFGERGRISMQNFIKPEQIEVFRSTGFTDEPEIMITQLPGRGYTFEVQEVMRCLRAGLTESPLVPWGATLGAARTLDRWRAIVAGTEPTPWSP